MGAMHNRTWKWSDRQIRIYDVVEADRKKSCAAWYHFAPGVIPQVTGQSVLAGGVRLTFENAEGIEIVEYDFAQGFNKSTRALSIRVTFQQNLSTTISF
jgi:hypothetical protein